MKKSQIKCKLNQEQQQLIRSQAIEICITENIAKIDSNNESF